jgi:hypothetical protein
MQLSQKDYFLLHGPILIYNSKGKDLQGDTLWGPIFCNFLKGF